MTSDEVAPNATGTQRSVGSMIGWFFLTLLLAPLPMIMIVPGQLFVIIVARTFRYSASSSYKYMLLMYAPGFLICSLIALAMGWTIMRKASPEHKKYLFNQSVVLFILLSILSLLIPFVIYFSFASGAASYDYARPLMGFVAGIAMFPLVPVVLAVLAYIAVLRVRTEVTAPGFHIGTVLGASWLSQYACLAVFSVFMMNATAPSKPFVECCIAASPDNVHCAIGDAKGTILIQKVSFPHGKMSISCAPLGVKSLCYSPDGRYLASGLSDDSLVIWDVQTMNKVKEIAPVQPSCCEYSADGSKAMLRSKDMQSLILFNTSSWEKETEIPIGNWHARDGVCSFAICPDLKSVVIGHNNGIVRQYKVEDGTVIHEFTPPEPIYPECRVSFLNENLMVVGTNGGITVWDFPSGTIVKKLEEHGKAVLKEVPIRTRNRIFMAAYLGYWIYDMTTGKAIVTKEFEHGVVERNITITPDGNKVLIVKDGELDTISTAW